jgi:hypothetical protein
VIVEEYENHGDSERHNHVTEVYNYGVSCRQAFLNRDFIYEGCVLTSLIQNILLLARDSPHLSFSRPEHSPRIAELSSPLSHAPNSTAHNVDIDIQTTLRLMQEQIQQQQALLQLQQARIQQVWKQNPLSRTADWSTRTLERPSSNLAKNFSMFTCHW